MSVRVCIYCVYQCRHVHQIQLCQINPILPCHDPWRSHDRSHVLRTCSSVLLVTQSKPNDPKGESFDQPPPPPKKPPPLLMCPDPLHPWIATRCPMTNTSSYFSGMVLPSQMLILGCGESKQCHSHDQQSYIYSSWM